jgi:Secretion system C-terminal sorting domain
LKIIIIFAKNLIQKIMKKLVLVLLLITEFAIGQCVNGTTTNPTAPTNPAFPNYLNRFDWETTPTLKYNTTFQPNSNTPNPFFSNQSVFQGIALQQDYKSENGWEAVAYNLGYDNNNTALTAPPQHTYLMMYNKYRGVLRILVKWSGVPSTFNKAQLTLQFAPGFQSNLLDMTTSEKPLLAPHIPNPKYTTFLTFFNDATSWSYADFKVNYDPCTCSFTDSARLQLYTNLIQNSTIILTGAVNGTITTIKDGAGSGTDESSGKFWNSLEGTGGKMISVSKDVQDFVDNSDKTFKKLKDGGITVNAITQLGNLMKTNKFLKAGLAAAPIVGEAVKFIGSLIGGGAGETAPTALAPMSVNLAVNLSGTVELKAPMHDFSIGLPGSANSATLAGIYGGQPLYNEPLGVFSLIDEPTMYYTESSYDQVEKAYRFSTNVFGGQSNFPSQLQQYPSDNLFRFTRRQYQMSGDKLRYTINPASNLELQDAQLMVVAEYSKPSLYYNANMPQYMGSESNGAIDVDADNGLPFKLYNDPISLADNQAYNTAAVGNKIDETNTIFQSSFPPIGEKYFNNKYVFDFMYDVQQITRRTDYFSFGLLTLRTKTIPPYNPVSPGNYTYYVTPKPEYLAPRVKSFSLKVILNLKRTDNPNAQNVLYVVTYPIKLIPGSTSYLAESYLASARYYGENTAITLPNQFVRVTDPTEINGICSGSAYRTNRVGTGILGLNDFGPQNQTNDLIYYPNPVQNKLYMKLNNNKIKNIIGIDGKKLSGFDIETLNKANQEEIELDFSSYPKGIYFVNYTDEKNNPKTAKIIKE